MCGIILLFFSCKKNENQSDAFPETNRESKIEIAQMEDHFIRNDSLIVALVSVVEKRVFSDARFEIEVETQKSEYDDSVIDTIKTFTYEQTQVKFFKTRNWENLAEASIQNADLDLFENIKIGMTKASFKEILDINFIHEQINIGNLEQTAVFSFNFENGILQSIEYEGYIY
uniref:hypothetical protein n=2 Tax=Flavobacterium sp. TaxID=239 RepID=UPI00404B0082